jgi:biopolymer transport protein ExbD
MVSAGSQKHEAASATQHPGTGPGGSVSMQIGIDEDGQVTIAGSPVGGPDDQHLQELVARLKDAVTADANRPVVITPTRSTKQQRVIDVLNACQAARVKNLAFGPVSD